MGIDISVVVPTHKRRGMLSKCLDSLIVQDYPRQRFEIIVVIDGPDNGVAEPLGRVRERHPNLKVLSQPRRGPASARNLGVKSSSGEIIGFIDDDCVVDKGWLGLMVEGHRRNPDATAIGGDTLTSGRRMPVVVSQFLSACSIETQIGNRREVIFFPTCNVSFKRHVFNRHRFDEKFPLPGGEDLEFFWRLFKERHRFVRDKAVRVIHYRSGTLSSFIKQAYIYGRGNLLVQHIHRNHPLLKELKTGRVSFWMATLINIMKIPRFSYLLGKRLIDENGIKEIYKRLFVYLYFSLHKIFYIAGNTLEFFRIAVKNLSSKEKIIRIPQLLILDITHSCNLSCRICDIWKTGQTEKDIESLYIKRALSRAKDLGINEIALSGGEPLLRKDIFELLDYAQKIHIKNLGILTNGVLLGEYIEKLKPYLTDNTISLVISLDSLRPDIHNEIRNSDFAWQRTVEGLKSLSTMKKEFTMLNFNVITIILSQNLEELAGLADFVKSLGANLLQFQPLLPNNLRMAERKKSIFWIPKERLSVLDMAIDELAQFKKDNPYFIKNSVKNLSLIKKYYRGSITSKDVECVSADRTILISNLGECTTCFSCYGDIKKQDLEKILGAEKIVKARKKAKDCPWPCLLPCFCDL